MSVSRAQREISSPEFTEWMAYSIWEPFGPEREDQRAGMIAALIANVNRDSSKRSEPYDVEDFFPRYGEQVQAEAATPVDLESKLMAWAAKVNAANAAGKQPSSELRPKAKE
jgi:hypothetical protein